jgi:hypothetical protein
MSARAALSAPRHTAPDPRAAAFAASLHASEAEELTLSAYHLIGGGRLPEAEAKYTAACEAQSNLCASMIALRLGLDAAKGGAL